MGVLWKLLFVCIILGGAQWMHSHPDSAMTQDFLHYWAQVRVHWAAFVEHAGEYLGKFPGYMRDLLDTAPKPKNGA